MSIFQYQNILHLLRCLLLLNELRKNGQNLIKNAPMCIEAPRVGNDNYLPLQKASNFYENCRPATACHRPSDFYSHFLSYFFVFKNLPGNTHYDLILTKNLHFLKIVRGAVLNILFL